MLPWCLKLSLFGSKLSFDFIDGLHLTIIDESHYTFYAVSHWTLWDSKGDTSWEYLVWSILKEWYSTPQKLPDKVESRDTKQLNFICLEKPWEHLKNKILWFRVLCFLTKCDFFFPRKQTLLLKKKINVRMSILTISVAFIFAHLALMYVHDINVWELGRIKEILPLSSQNFAFFIQD